MDYKRRFLLKAFAPRLIGSYEDFKQKLLTEYSKEEIDRMYLNELKFKKA